MARVEGGFFGKWSGKIGNLVYYQRNGKTITRIIGTRTAPFSEAQLGSQQAFGLASHLLKPLSLFINVGFSGVAAGTDKSPRNLAQAYNRKNAVTGVYPEQEIDFSKALFSQGGLPLAENPMVEKISEGLHFQWLADPNMLYPRSADQAMLMVYLPKTSEVFYKTYGAERNNGHDILMIPEPKRNDGMEVYLSFCSADRKTQSNSQYLGKINT